MIVGMKMTRPNDLPTTSGAELSNQNRRSGRIDSLSISSVLNTNSIRLILIQNHGRILPQPDEVNLVRLYCICLDGQMPTRCC